MTNKFLIIFSAFALICILAFVLYPSKIPESPLSLSQPTTNHQLPTTNYVILGFAPYWNLKKITPDAETSITHYAYFNLLLSGDGTLYTHVNRREQEPGFTGYQKLLTAGAPHNLILTFMPESQDALARILADPTARQTAIQTIIAKLQEAHASGVNIDFEPLGSISPALRNNFTIFINELRSALSQLPTINYQLSISIYPSAASKPRIWDLPTLAEYTDYFVVMAYDYTMPGEGKSGPNSPLRGAGQLFEHDIITNLAEISSDVTPNKILLGIPFYGYEWTVDTSEKYVPTIGRAQVASLERINTLISEHTLELLWDRNSLTPYAIRRDNGAIVSQIYYENIDSIKLKLDLVKASGLGGIAIWALGYEGNSPTLWQTIRSLNE